jgi:hypothetical protein
MGLTHFPNGITSFGVPIVGSGSILTTGNVFFVSSVTGSNGNSGLDPTQPLATLDYAVGKCTANNGDYIIAMENHAETIASATSLVIDVAGITILGLGRGSDRPTLNFSVETGTIPISAANVTVQNILCTGGIDVIVNMITVSAADVTLLDIELRDVTGQMVSGITTTAAADRLLIDRFTFRGAAAAGADTAISIVGGDGITLRNLWIDGNFAVACIEGVTTASTNLTIGGWDQSSYLRTRITTDVTITLHANGTGNVGPNIASRTFQDAANITETIVGAQMQFFLPLPVCNADNESGLDWNGTPSTD